MVYLRQLMFRLIPPGWDHHPCFSDKGSEAQENSGLWSGLHCQPWVSCDGNLDLSDPESTLPLPWGMEKRSWFILKWEIHSELSWVEFSGVQSLSRVRLFAAPWTAAHQASLSITNSQSWLKLLSFESAMTFSHLILCHPHFLPPSICPSIRVFSNESVLQIRWPKYWSFSFSISPSNEHPRLISFRMDWLDLLAVQGTLKSLPNTTVQKHQFFGTQLSS